MVLDKISDDDAKGKVFQTQLPVSRVRAVMKTVPDVGNINPEALIMVCRAAEMFINYMTENSFDVKSKAFDYINLSTFVEKEEDKLDFLSQILPKKITVREFQKLQQESSEESEESSDESEESSEESDATGSVIEIQSNSSASTNKEGKSSKPKNSLKPNETIEIESSEDEKENNEPVKHTTGDSTP